MNKILPLIIIALFANLLTIVLYDYAHSQPGGTGTGLAFAVIWMPALWLTTLITAAVIAVKRSKIIFQSPLLKWSLPALLFCTPIPALILYNITSPTPETLRSSSIYRTSGGKIYKTEYWYYTSNRNDYVQMHFVADSAAERMQGEEAFKKDSTWIYLSSKGDNSKIETYKEGRLITSAL